MNLPHGAASADQLAPIFNSVSVHGAPLLAQEVALTAYCSVVVCTVMVWTWALCVPEEVEIVTRNGLTMPIVAYYITRLATLGACICTVVLGLDLQLYLPFSIAFLWITQSSTGLLFFFRIRAVYKQAKSIRYGFFVMWILVTVSPLLMFLRPTIRCYILHKHCYVWGPFTLPGNISVLANDTLVFIGVSLHAYRNMALDTSQMTHVRRFKLLVQGNGLYKVSKMLLKSGQLYYGQVCRDVLSTVINALLLGNSAIIGVQIWTTITVCLGQRYSQTVAMTYTPFASTLACKVFRMVMLCDTIEDPLNTLEIHEMFEDLIVEIE